ncbi:HlyD family efflux transporter periplasmic adaptor subunit [Phreatobacter aquaticus]|uniref:HlyD family efflux transporter periplasmic adaptor subunit n=1 Tax=Phreatobacter aquaticus TaxID=2570229 RepID=A0A4D7QC96_9HYPH|nr:HlyD family efflux transporter periplasmic adaptor subunit [Phreatobacter aquaticus]QCK85620.1 HlyD family efflux transporter periplasmic adaptor subunit [Phreatobacter aquaticus]
MRLRARSLWTIVVVAVALAAGAFVWLMRFAPIAVAGAQTIDNVPVEVFALGTVEARIVTRVGFKVSGTLVELTADHGDRVAAGALLARIDPREQQARAAKARSGIANAEAALAVAEAVSNRASVVHAQRQQANQRRQTLLARGTVSVEQAEEAQLTEATALADTLVARSEVTAARARLEDSRAQFAFEGVVLNQHELRAPFDALVISRSRELGGVAAAGETLFTLVDPATYWILAYLDEARSGLIAEGHQVLIRLRSLPGQAFSGRVARIGLESDRVNEERRIYVVCQNCPPAYVLGEQAEVVVTAATLARATLVPETAIDELVHGRGKVWAVDDGRLVRRAIVVGHRTIDGRYEVVSGHDGVTIVTSRHPRFREGRSVTVDQVPRR